jgi:hypothetical protein
MYKQRIHSDFQIACPLPNLTIEWFNSGMGNNGPEVWKIAFQPKKSVSL